jgi:hypothetical protein
MKVNDRRIVSRVLLGFPGWFRLCFFEFPMCWYAVFIKGNAVNVDCCKAWNIMVEESKGAESVSPEKLLIDNPSTFQFHAAYLAYSDCFDRTANPEGRKRLNESILALQQGQIDFPTFYRNISQFRSEDSFQHNYGRAVFKTQRKREWRRKTQKHERIVRHKK